jgi:hypothetical protein
MTSLRHRRRHRRKFEEKAEPIAGATDMYNCGKEGGGTNRAWAAAAIMPGAKVLKGAKALETGENRRAAPTYCWICRQ